MAEWQPAFPGQRPPFQPDNEAPLVSGAYSERKIAPLAASIIERARSDPAWPPYLDDPSYHHAVDAWGRAEAIVALLADWLAQKDVTDWLTETSTEETEETRTNAGSRRRTVGRRIGSALEMLRRWESVAGNHRSRLGLDH